MQINPLAIQVSPVCKATSSKILFEMYLIINVYVGGYNSKISSFYYDSCGQISGANEDSSITKDNREIIFECDLVKHRANA